MSEIFDYTEIRRKKQQELRQFLDSRAYLQVDDVPLDPDSEDFFANLKQAAKQSLASPDDPSTARIRSVRIAKALIGVNNNLRISFLKFLAQDLSAIDVERARIAIENSEDNAPELYQAREALTPPWEQLFGRLLNHDAGLLLAIELHYSLGQHLRDLRKHNKSLDQSLVNLKTGISRLLKNLLDVSFLKLEPIRANQASLELLKTLQERERVLPFEHLEDLQTRLEQDRRVYSIYHPQLSENPLTVVYVALTDSLSSSIDNLINKHRQPIDTKKATHAIFYSIATDTKLEGMGLGEPLIKEFALSKIKEEFPYIGNYATLSPVPGFTNWLQQKNNDEFFKLLMLESELDTISSDSGNNPLTILKNAIELSQNGIIHKSLLGSSNVLSVWESIFSRLCLVYLLSLNTKGGILNPVARFHLGNGATMKRINFLSNTSVNGIINSMAMTVNYSYSPSQLVRNVNAYHNSVGNIIHKELGSLIRADCALKNFFTEYQNELHPAAFRSLINS